MGIKYSVNERFFEEWNSTMAYVLGYFYADGSMYPSARGKYVLVTSIDESTIKKIKKWLDSKHTIRIEPPKLAKWEKKVVSQNRECKIV